MHTVSTYAPLSLSLNTTIRTTTYSLSAISHSLTYSLPRWMSDQPMPHKTAIHFDYHFQEKVKQILNYGIEQ